MGERQAKDEPGMARGPEWRDYSAKAQRYDSAALRLILAGGGAVCVGLGVAGLFLPVLPTTLFLLLAAALFARSSRRVYNWLLNHSLLGPIILEWREHRAMPRRAKRVALLLFIGVSARCPSSSSCPQVAQRLVGAAGLVMEAVDQVNAFARWGEPLDLAGRYGQSLLAFSHLVRPISPIPASINA